MHRAIAAWLIAIPWRAVLVTALASAFVPGPIVAGAIPVLVTLAHGTKWGLQAMLVAVVSFGAVAVAAQLPMAMTLGITIVLLIVPFVLAQVFERYGSLRLCFQLAVLAAGATVVAIHATFDDATAVWRAFASQYFAAVAEHSGDTGGLTGDSWSVAMVAATNWGTVASNCMLASLGLLFLGMWWLSLVRSPGAFGKEFQGIQLGKTLGYVVLILFVAASVAHVLSVSIPMIDALVLVAVIALVLQGLSVLHRAKAQGKLGRGWLVVAYVALIGLGVVAVPLLSVLGVVDNWRRVA